MTVRAMTGAERVAAAFARAREERRLALVTYLVVGYPDLATSDALVRAAIDAGADVVELGVPFSDPLADGATIQRASERALANGVRIDDVLRVGAEVARAHETPLLLMGYANPFYAYGLARLAREAVALGLAGFIVPDLPAEEAGELEAACAEHGLVRVSLVAPTTPEERLARIVPGCAGFVYCVSVTGVTGARAALSAEVAEFVERVRRHARVPVAVGFGISAPEHVRALAGVADGIVVGSALADAIASGGDPVASLRAAVASLRSAC